MTSASSAGDVDLAGIKNQAGDCKLGAFIYKKHKNA